MSTVHSSKLSQPTSIYQHQSIIQTITLITLHPLIVQTKTIIAIATHLSSHSYPLALIVLINQSHHTIHLPLISTHWLHGSSLYLYIHCKCSQSTVSNTKHIQLNQSQILINPFQCTSYSITIGSNRFRYHADINTTLFRL